MPWDEKGKWISDAEWTRRMVESGKLKLPTSTTAPTGVVSPKAAPSLPVPAVAPSAIDVEAAKAQQEFEKRHPTLAKVLRGWKSAVEHTLLHPRIRPWGEAVGEAFGRTLAGIEPSTPHKKMGPVGEITAGLVGGGAAMAFGLGGGLVPGAGVALSQAERLAGRLGAEAAEEIAPKLAPRVIAALRGAPPLAKAVGRAALVEAPAWWGYERAAYPEEHKPSVKQLPEYMAQFGAFVGVTGAAAEALPRLVRYLRGAKAVRPEVKPPEAKAEEVKPPVAEVKPPEVPTAEVKPPEAPAPKPPEVPPAEELPVKVGERMTAYRKRSGKEYTGVVERVYRGKQGQLLADVRLDDGTLKTIPASRKHTEWRVPEVQVSKVEVPEAPKVEAPKVEAPKAEVPTPQLEAPKVEAELGHNLAESPLIDRFPDGRPVAYFAREEAGPMTLTIVFPDDAHWQLYHYREYKGVTPEQLRRAAESGRRPDLLAVAVPEAREALRRTLGLPEGADLARVAEEYRATIDAATKNLPAGARYEAPPIGRAEARAPEAPKIEAVEVPPAPEVKPEVPPAPAKPYEGLRPGTEEWMRVWREHPELQEEMLAYGREKGYLPPKPEATKIQEAPPGLPISPLTPEQQQQARTAVKEIVTTFERLGTPIRVGRYYEKARGIYKVRPETIRTKLWGDVVAISHEVGHHLDKLWKLSSIAQHRNELIALAKAVGAKGKTPADLAREGVAEFVRLAIADPATAQKQAPGMWRVWQDLLNQHPEVANVLEEAGRRIRGLMSASPEERLLSTMSIGEAPTRRRVFQSWNDFMAKMVDELAALDPFRQAAEAKLGRKLEPLEDPMMLAWRARGWQGKASIFLREGVRDAVGNKVAPSFREAVEVAVAGAKGAERAARINQFRAYAYARRLLEIAPRVRVLPGEGTFGREQVLADAQAAIAKFDSPAFRQTFDMLQRYQEQLIRQTLGTSGLYTQEMIDQIIAANEAYLPLHRVFEAMEAGRTKGAGRGYVDIQRAIKKLKGSGRLVVDPLESIVKNTYYFTSLAERNKVGVAVAELAEKAEGLGGWAERVMPKRYAQTVNLEEVLERASKELYEAVKDVADDLGLDLERTVTLFRPAVVASPKENIAIIWRNGKPELWQLHPGLYEAMKWLDHATLHPLLELLSYPAKMLRAGAVWYNPVFWLRNPLRDQFTAFVYSKYGYIPGVDLLRGIFHVLRRDELYQLYHASGAAQSTLVSFDRNYLQRDLRALLGEGRPSVLNFLQEISETMEIATRIGEFERGLRRLGRTEEGLLKAALAARDITVDFGRAGTWGKQINKFAAFFNANVQGVDKMIRVFKEDPVGATFRAALGITLPSIALYLINRKNPNYWALSEYERDMYWHIPLPGGRSFIRISKPFEPGLLFGSFFERVLQWVDKQDPSAVDNLTETWKPFLSNLWHGVVPNPFPTVISPPLGWLWREYRTHRPVVPVWERELPPEAQYGPFTSTVGRLVGKALGISPRWFDEFVRSYVGGMGLFAVDVIDEALKAAGLPSPPARGGIPFLRDFIAKPTSSSDPLVQQFYDAVNQVEGKYRAARARVERGEVEGLTPDELMAGVQASVLRRQTEVLTVLRRIQRMAMTSPNLTDEEKRLVWEVLDSAIMNHVRSLFGLPMVWNPPEETEAATKLLPEVVAEYMRRQQTLEQATKILQQLRGH